MLLSVAERLVLLYILPAENTRETMKIARTLKEGLSFSEQEFKDFKIVNDNGSFQWDPAVAKEKDVRIGDKAMGMLLEGFEIADRRKQIREQHLDVWDRLEKEATDGT